MTNQQKFPCQKGVTLVELMVSITIGMVIVLFLTSLYIGSRRGYKISDDQSRMNEEGRAVLNLVGRNLMQAGAGSPMSASVKNPATTFTQWGGGPGLRICDYGFSNPTGSNFTCLASGSNAGFEVAYNTENTVNTALGAGTDCNGQTVLPIASGERIAINRFFLATGAGDTFPSLYCAGNGSATAQPLLKDVVDMQLIYGVNRGLAASNAADTYYNTFNAQAPSATFDIGTSTAANSRWRDVISVEVCLELTASNKAVTASIQQYVNCKGATVSAPTGQLRAVLRGIYTLRQNASPT